MAEILFKPKELYENSLKNQFHNGAVEYFDNLEKESKVDAETNRKHVSELKEITKERQKAEEKVNSKNNFKTLMIVFAVLSFIAFAVLFLVGLYTDAWYYYLIGALFAILGIALIVFICTKIKKQAQELAIKVAIIKQDEEAAFKKCEEDMGPLNNLFDWDIPQKILEKTTPIIDLDPYFSSKRMDFMGKMFGFKERDDEEQSTLQVLTGNIQGNPFVEERHISHTMGEKTYTGTLVITWTETHYDKDGHAHTTVHTQTLRAYAKHDCPFYSRMTKLVYANEAAPKLSFSRESSAINTKNEKERAKLVKNRAKDLAKMAEASVKQGKDFTPTGNDEFDAFFGGENRDNEVEFRLLFTPLAQANMLELIKDPKPFGDDFSFHKVGKLNLIVSAHSQNFDYAADPYYFRGYDIDAMKGKFVSYCDSFIKSLYFDLAPILSIPLYQMHKPFAFTYLDEYPSNYSAYEHQALLNGMPFDTFAPEDVDDSVPLIIRSNFEEKVGQTDIVSVKSFGYETTPMTDFVPKLGGDGHMHSVPVHWTQYDLVEAEGQAGIRYIGCSLQRFLQSLKKLQDLGIVSEDAPFNYERGFLVFTNVEKYTKEIDDEITSIFKDENVA